MDLVSDVKKAQKGNKKAFCNLIGLYDTHLYRIAMCILKNNEVQRTLYRKQ